DPRTFGSGNPGTTNVLRTGNRKAALFTLLGDAIKGWVPVFIAFQFFWHSALTASDIAYVAIATFLGHLYPIYFRFKGGKGVATALGILLAFSLKLGLCVAIIWIVFLKAFRISSLSALIAALSSPILAFFFLSEPSWKWAVALIATMLIIRHKLNIQKLISGKENRIGS
ncbi:MAG: glycerol-3-phosphate 1-O-acyltransferase PlsY, partial [Pseudomonadota bacterium]|nr:glycerol-3-phosphate 1-O-acyltransferase PlsY [Pseudomonadota bacterium]